MNNMKWSVCVCLFLLQYFMHFGGVFYTNRKSYEYIMGGYTKFIRKILSQYMGADIYVHGDNIVVRMLYTREFVVVVENPTLVI